MAVPIGLPLRDWSVKRKEKKEQVRSENRILRTVIWDGSPKQVSVPNAYVLEDIYLEVIPDGEIWTKTVLVASS